MNEETKMVKYLVNEIAYRNSKSRVLDKVKLSGMDWEKLLSIIKYHELAPFLYVLLKDTKDAISTKIFNLIKSYHYSYLSIYMKLEEELSIILRKAKKNNILIVPIKGFSLVNQYYKNFGFRPLTDIDLLVREESFDEGVRLLESLGYNKYLFDRTERYWRTYQCHLGLNKQKENINVIAELHFALDFRRYKTDIMPGVWNRLRKSAIDTEPCMVLSPEDTLFCLALHQRRFGKVFNLKYICDVGMLLKKDTLDWNYIINTAYNEKIRASLYFLLAQARFVLDININQYLDALKIPYLQRNFISKLIAKFTYSPPAKSELPYAYTLCHFALYDDMAYPFKYILNIPQEQFAKFYSLPLYSRQTSGKYRLRFLYIIYGLIKNYLTKYLRGPLGNSFFL